MKRWCVALTAALLVCLLLTAIPAAAAGPLDNETTIIITRNSGQTELKPSQQESCFWEYPTLTAGQHRNDGVLWLSNQSGKNATVTLANFSLPTDNEAAMNYLAALKLTVRANDKVVFSDTYDKAGNLSITVDVPKGEKTPIYFEMGCDFTYTGECTLGEENGIYSKYTVEYSGSGFFSSPWFYAGVGVLVAAAIIVLIVTKKKKEN